MKIGRDKELFDGEHIRCDARYNPDTTLLWLVIRLGLLREIDPKTDQPYESFAIMGQDASYENVRNACEQLVKAGETPDSMRKKDEEHLRDCAACRAVRKQWGVTLPEPRPNATRAAIERQITGL